MNLKRPQLLGRDTIYSGRYKKKLFSSDVLQPFAEAKVEDLVRHPLSGKPLMCLRITATGQVLRVTAVRGYKTGDVLTAEDIPRLSQLVEGTTVCCITDPRKKTAALIRPGCKGVYVGKKDKRYQVRVGRRIISFEDLLCMKGVAAGGDAHIKPMLKAGVAYKIKKASLKKYPTVSAHKMNVIDSQTGGSSRKKRGAPTCIARNTPGAKTGNLAPRRTGRRR